MCSIQPVNELLFFSYQPSAISFQPRFLLIFNPFVIPDISMNSHPHPPLKHPKSTLTPTPTPNWGGKDIILHHLSQMFLKNYGFGDPVFLFTYGISALPLLLTLPKDIPNKARLDGVFSANQREARGYRLTLCWLAEKTPSSSVYYFLSPDKSLQIPYSVFEIRYSTD